MTSESNALNLAQSAFEAVCKERDEARDQLQALREVIREVIDSLHKCSRVIGAPKTYDWADEDVCDAAYNSAQAALTKLQPFIKP